MKYRSPATLTSCSALILGFFVTASSLEAATVSVADTTVVSTGASNTDDFLDSNPDDPLIDVREVSQGNSTIRATATSEANALVLDQQVDDFSVAGELLSAELERVNSGGDLGLLSANSEYQITFNLAPGESGDLALDFNYVLQNLGVPAELSWSLTGPDVNIASFTGSVNASTNPSTLSAATSQSARLNTAGTYAFTITASTSSAALPNDGIGLKSISGITGFSLDYVAVPEPSTGALALLSSLALLKRRRNSFF